ncbi:MAG TPA: glycosyltransferase [Chitinophagaceae bacterium]|nr:glycosyltransferase [Chitinophagaceae bacterium]
MIPVYNCAAFLPGALLSVLQQAPGEDAMQIEVIDDCSTDADVEKLVNEIGKGRVLYYRQPQNVGSVRNFETCLNRSTGHLIHLLHGDDTVKPGFYAKMKSLLERFPEAGAAFCNYDFIDDNNKYLHTNYEECPRDCILEDFLYVMAERCATQYASIAVKREVYEKLGGFYGRFYGEDWEMWTRIARDYPVAYTPEILAGYRIHSSNISSARFQNGENFNDIRGVLDQINSYFPPDKRRLMKKRGLRNYARYALGNTEYIWHVSRDKRTVYSQLRGALRMWIDRQILFKAAKMYLKVWLHPFRKLIGNVKY